jgi:hypothetical protein
MFNDYMQPAQKSSPVIFEGSAAFSEALFLFRL